MKRIDLDHDCKIFSLSSYLTKSSTEDSTSLPRNPEHTAAPDVENEPNIEPHSCRSKSFQMEALEKNFPESGLDEQSKVSFLNEESELEIRLWLHEIKRILISRRLKLISNSTNEVDLFDGVLTMDYQIVESKKGCAVILSLTKAKGKKAFLSLQDASNWLIKEASQDLCGW